MESNRYPRDFLVAEIKRVAKIVGEMPTMLQFDKFSDIAAVTVAKRFKGWKNALAAAGFDSLKSKTKYEVQELKNELIRVATQLGHTPSYDEFDECSNFSASTVLKRLGGSWPSAYSSVGLPPPIIGNKHQVVGGWNKGQRKFNIAKDELFYLYETEGLSASAIAVRLGTSKNSVLRALREHGIAIKRLHYSMPKATSIEELMYGELERRNVPFAKQQVIDGLYLVDAIIMGPRIVIECDGEYWHSLPGATERDQKKTKYLQSRGYIVLRFSEAVLKADIQSCGQKVVEALLSRIDAK
jgi:very-short-patch-repair endonuclease